MGVDFEATGNGRTDGANARDCDGKPFP